MTAHVRSFKCLGPLCSKHKNVFRLFEDLLGIDQVGEDPTHKSNIFGELEGAGILVPSDALCYY